MANRILSNFSSAAKSNLIKSKFSKESSRVVSVLKGQHICCNNKKYDNKLKLVVSRLHQHKGVKYHLLSLLSIGDNVNFANFSRQYRCDSLFPVVSCNNQLLLRGVNDLEPEPALAALWNPTTGEIQTLPRSDPQFEIDFDSTTLYGFGFDPKTEGDYKVIRVIKNTSYYFQHNDFEVEIYSLKTDTWERFACPPKYVNPTHAPSLFINGSQYWLALCSRQPQFNKADVILRFEFANKKLAADIPLPDDICEQSHFMLAELEGSLGVVAYSPNLGLEMWVWNEGSLSWSRRREYEWATINGGVQRLLGLFNNDQLVLFPPARCAGTDFEGELVLFDCGTRVLKNLGFKSDPPPGHSGAMEVFAYVQSSEKEEEVKHRENERKMKRCVGTLINSTTFISKLAPINVIDDSKQKPNNNNKPKLLFCHDFEGTLYYLSQTSPPTGPDNSLKDISDNVLFNFPTFGFVPTASCNGALLLCYVDSDRRVVALWNPTTDEVKKLPDQVLYHVCYGFGFDPKADEGNYKVIRFIPKMNETRTSTMRAQLYSLKADSWKDLASSFSRYFSLEQPSLYINGFCYWVASRYKDCIVSFDFANENFSSAPHIPLPPPNYYDDKNTFFHNLLTQYHGSLAALVYTMTHAEKYSLFEPQNTKPLEILQLWVWNNDEWTRESVIHVPVGIEKPLGLFGNNQLYLQGSNGQVLIFDCAKGGELKSLCPSLRFTMENWGDSDRRRDYIFPYVESSFPLNGEKIIRASHKIIDD